VVIAAGLIDQHGKPKYTGLHAFRHFYASWCINRRADGGLELPAKIVQERLGHASITITMDRYGHLFPSDDNGSELKEAELVRGGHRDLVGDAGRPVESSFRNAKCPRHIAGTQAG
jgi:hypothetical protein